MWSEEALVSDFGLHQRKLTFLLEFAQPLPCRACQGHLESPLALNYVQLLYTQKKKRMPESCCHAMFGLPFVSTTLVQMTFQMG